jgi:hypothetical protein
MIALQFPTAARGPRPEERVSTNRARITAARVRFKGITKKRDRIFIRHWEAS